MTDPYRPFPSTPVRAPEFPRTRLTRAGLDDGTVDRLEGEFGQLDAAGRVEFAEFVAARSDDAVRDRFAAGAATDTRPASATPTYEELNDETIDELDDRLRAWNDAHPNQHLTIAGRKGEKIGRLLDAYEGEQGASTPEVAPPGTAATGPEQPAGEVLPTAPTATTPEGAPQTAATAPGAGVGTVETGGASTGA